MVKSVVFSSSFLNDCTGKRQIQKIFSSKLSRTETMKMLFQTLRLKKNKNVTTEEKWKCSTEKKKMKVL